MNTVIEDHPCDRRQFLAVTSAALLALAIKLDPKHPPTKPLYVIYDKVGKPNRNGRLYARELWEKQIGKCVQLVMDKPSEATTFNDVAGTVTIVAVDDKNVYADMRLAENKCGKQAAIMLGYGCVAHVAGTGRVDEAGFVTDYVLESAHIARERA